MVLNSETKLPEPTPELLLIPEFNQLWKKKQPIDGDREGRNKTRNLQEMGYIYFSAVYDSRFRHLNPEEKEKRILTLLKLPEDWKPSDLIKAALEIYIDMQNTGTYDLVASMEGLNKDLSLWVKEKRRLIAAGTLPPKDVGEVLDIASRLKNIVNEFKEARALLEMEQEASAKGRKGRVTNKYEIPIKPIR